MTNKLYFAHRIDCESTQPAIRSAELGRRASLGFAAVLESNALRGTFYCIPSEVQANSEVYHDIKKRGHEVGLHVHPADLGYEEFLGIYSGDTQREIIEKSTETFSQALGFRPCAICLGYGSSNDMTRGVLYELGFRHGVSQIPGRILPECASVAAGAPLDVHYAHRWNRVLQGDLDFVEIPNTVDPDSRMWGGKHPQDLRVELVDAKNHYYTILKAVERQVRENTALKILVSCTHNIFNYDDPKDFRRQTLEGVITHAKHVAEANGLQLVGATEAQIAQCFRATVPLPSQPKLELDRRGYALL